MMPASLKSTAWDCLFQTWQPLLSDSSSLTLYTNPTNLNDARVFLLGTRIKFAIYLLLQDWHIFNSTEHERLIEGALGR